MNDDIDLKNEMYKLTDKMRKHVDKIGGGLRYVIVLYDDTTFHLGVDPPIFINQDITALKEVLEGAIRELNDCEVESASPEVN